MTTSTSVSVLRALFTHNDWARNQLLDAAAPLTAAQLDTPFEMGPGTLRMTLQHLWRAEHWWLDRWRRREDDRGPADPAMDLAELRARFEETARDRTALLDEVGTAGERARHEFTFEGRTHALPLGDMMLHVCNHGYHHRAQAKNMLRRLGVEPPTLDYLVPFMRFDDWLEVAFDRDTIAEYYRYTDDAFRCVHRLAAALTDEQLDRPFEMSMGTLRKTLLHIYDAERWWLENWTSAPPGRFEVLPASTSLETLSDLFESVRARRNELLEGLDAAALQRVIIARPAPDVELNFNLGTTMMQLCGHGTHHRAHCVHMLRHLGLATPDLDYCDWALGLWQV